MAIRFGDAVSGFLEGAKAKRQAQNDQIEQAKTLAVLSDSGYDVSPSAFGQTTINRNSQFGAVPAGFVRVNGKVVQDPTYMNPLEQARMKNLSGGGIFGGVNAAGDPVNQPTTEERMATLSPENQALVKGLTDYTVDPSSISSRTNMRGQLVGMAKEVDPTYDMTQYPTRSKYRQEVSSGKVGANVRGFNTAIQHLGELNDATGKVPSSPIQPIEAMQRFGAKTFAGNSPTALGIQQEEAALTAVSGELANIFKNSGGTDQEIDKWFKAYNPNASREAKRQFIKTGVDLMKGRLGALGDDYKRVMGKENPTPYMSDKSQQTIDQMFGGGAQPNQSGGKSGGVLHVDAKGNKAMVYPDGSFEEIK